MFALLMFDRDGRLAGGAVADDQLALAAADGDHGVDGHDAGLDGLVDRFALDDAGGDLLDGVSYVELDGAFAVHGLAEDIHHAAEQALADRHVQEAAGGLDLGALGDFREIAQEDAADLGFLEVEGEAEEAVGKLDQLVEHDVAETFDLRDAIAGLAHDAGIGHGGRGFEAGDLRFKFLENGAHGMCGINGLNSCELLVEPVEPAADAAVPDIAADADAKAADEVWIDTKISGETLAVLGLEIAEDALGGVRAQLRGALDDGVALVELETDEAMVILEDVHVMARLAGDELAYEAADFPGIKLAVGKAGAE
jgi:hypothetical protein